MLLSFLITQPQRPTQKLSILLTSTIEGMCKILYMIRTAYESHEMTQLKRNMMGHNRRHKRGQKVIFGYLQTLK